MKIHRIDLLNLNSLYGEHSVDLDAALGGSSLFLIYGPTGSGKSTLMDAVSLALFGATPRLDGKRHGPETWDPREIMSRDTGKCAAGVVFSKLQGGRRRMYRARWACRRAREKPDGTPQTPARSLEEWTDDGAWVVRVSSSKKKEFAPVFRDVLEGFGVQDFNRSMLLAQGQFDAFLGAKKEQRAEILERLTDTSIYQQLGERAARVHRAHESHLKKLRTLLEAGGGLTDEALERVTAAHAAHAERLAVAEGAHRRAESSLAWVHEQGARQRQLSEAEQQAVALRVREVEAEPALRALKQHERGEQAGGFAVLDDLRRGREEERRLGGELQRLLHQLPGLKETSGQRERQLVDTRALEQGARVDLQALRPVAATAESALVASTLADNLRDQVGVRHVQAEEQWAAGKLELTACEGRLDLARQRETEALVAIDNHAQDALLVEAWDGLRTRVDLLVAACARLSSEGEGLAVRIAAAAGDRETLRTEQQAYQQGEATVIAPLLRAAEHARGALADRLAGDGMSEVRQRRRDRVQQLSARQGRLQQTLGVVVTWHAAVRRRDELTQQVLSLSKSHAAARGAVQRHEQAVAHAVGQADVARASLARVQRIMDLVAHRVALEDDKECPLCGSTTHPWVDDAKRQDDDAALRGVVAEAEQQVAHLHKAHTQATREHRAAEERHHKLAAQLELLSAQRRQATSNADAQRPTAHEMLTSVGLRIDTGKTAVDAEIDQVGVQIIDAQSALVDLDMAQQTLHAAQEALRTAAEARRVQQRELVVRSAGLDERERTLQADRVQLDRLRSEVQAERLACDVALRGAGLAVSGADPAAWRLQGDEVRRVHLGRLTTRDRAVAEAQRIDKERQGLVRLVEQHKQLVDGLAVELKSKNHDGREAAHLRDAAISALQRCWQAALQQQPRGSQWALSAMASPADLVGAQERWCDAKKSDLDRVVVADQQARRRLHHVQSQLGGLEQQLSRQRQDLDRHGVILAEVLGVLHIESEQDLGALRLSVHVLAQHRQQQLALQGARREVSARVEERRVRLEQHLEVRPAELPENPDIDMMTDAVVRCHQALQVAIATHQATGDQLRDHNRAVEEQAERRLALQQAEQRARVWSTLHGYIGKNDGGKFKEFAQALNLQQLLDKANVHLTRLTDRYRLVPRVVDGLPDLEFDLQDLWQVGACVAPRSLSGGERFLVSLALALGLSDFRAVKMPVETLLLDEGFGTLDAQTLSTAIAALSQLQADGRQVGIISHVVGLRERIDAQVEVRRLGAGRSTVCVGNAAS